MSKIKVVVHGVMGKMGQQVLNSVTEAEDMIPVGGADYMLATNEVALPDNTGTVKGSKDLQQVISGADVVIDFTNADGARNVMSIAALNGVNCVIGSTGLSKEDIDLADDLADDNNISIFIAPNFAMGGVLMMHLVRESAKFFEYADLTEVHHEAKIDAPSGTAIAIAQAALDGKGTRFLAPKAEKELIDHTRGGEHEGVVIHSGRMPGRVAHHEMVFGSTGQTLTIRHDSINRESFMPGVLMAVRASQGLKGLTVGLDKLMGL